jgi:LysR family glycine cleavage system transcriptional activator
MSIYLSIYIDSLYTDEMNITHLNALRALEASLRCGNFRAASAELGVTPAAVGQQIRTLEDYLERKLFLRTTTGATPIADTEAVADRLTASLSALEGVLEQLSRRRQPNRIAINLPASFAENWFTRHIAEFYQQHSEIDLRLDASNRMVDLLVEDFDFAIRYCEPPSDHYDYVDLFGDKVIAVCSPAFAKKHRLTQKRRNLARVPLVQLEHRTPDPEWPNWEMWGDRFGFDRHGLDAGVRISQVSSGLQMAAVGQGLVLSGITEAFHALREGIVVAPFGTSMSYPTGYLYRLVSVHGRGLSTLQRRFREWVIQTGGQFKSEAERLTTASG